jgi:hypothetical protein
LWWPCTSAAIERSFSLAGTLVELGEKCKPFSYSGLIDTKNRNKGNEDFKAAAVGLFCNGDVEARFTKPE